MQSVCKICKKPINNGENITVCAKCGAINHTECLKNLGCICEKVNTNVKVRKTYNDCEKSKDRVEQMKSNFSAMPNCCWDSYCSSKEIDMNEYIEFKSKPKYRETVTKLQEHFGFYAMEALKNKNEQTEDTDCYTIEYSAQLTIYGENGYETTDLCDFIKGILYDLPKADGFKIVSNYTGCYYDGYDENDEVIWVYDDNGKLQMVKFEDDKFKDTIGRMGQLEQFVYKKYEYFHEYCEGICEKFENNKWVNLEELYTEDIVDRDFGNDWFCTFVTLLIDFDCDRYPKILEALKDSVRKHYPKDYIHYCEEQWEEYVREDKAFPLIDSGWWYPRSLREVQDFLDEINTILKPIKFRSDVNAEWFQKGNPFAIAKILCEENKFVIKGTQF